LDLFSNGLGYVSIKLAQIGSRTRPSQTLTGKEDRPVARQDSELCSSPCRLQIEGFLFPVMSGPNQQRNGKIPRKVAGCAWLDLAQLRPTGANRNLRGWIFLVSSSWFGSFIVCTTSTLSATVDRLLNLFATVTDCWKGRRCKLMNDMACFTIAWHPCPGC
jgi:hypothetical protein